MDSIPDPILELPICSWITSDGAQIRSGEWVQESTIPLKRLQEMMEAALQFDWGIALECPKRIYMNQKAVDAYRAMNQAKSASLNLEKIVYENCLDQWQPDIPVFKVCLMVSHPIPALESFEMLDVLQVNENLIELHPPGIHKGSALRLVQEHLGISCQDTICVADGKNDLPMTSACSCFIAMKESPSEVKHCADLVCTAPMETGIAKALVDIGLLPDKPSVTKAVISASPKERNNPIWNQP